MDMNHGLFFVPPVNIYAGDYPDCRGAKILIIAAGARQKPGQTRLQLMKENTGICQAIAEQAAAYLDQAILLVTTNPVDLMTYTVTP